MRRTFSAQRVIFCGSDGEGHATRAAAESALRVIRNQPRGIWWQESVPPESALARAAERHGWGSEQVVDVLETRIAAVSSLLVCSLEEAVSLLLQSARLAGVSDDVLIGRLLTLQHLLPEADITRLVRGNLELLLREDAMERAKQSV
eukprot:CAMPEP_0198215500 /NCGR_PEP_ID=MMETSP1445-20131203/50295_1 /TAXON_ID=36898 /ORGANISM="Pyramimonas sp., Strain CCMP2087" /LENGTH=146 /DNA_ID=CAMNT_0043891253 /DNA_START=442 /DNA_END=879 /DNA_ORIENTATION=-